MAKVVVYDPSHPAVANAVVAYHTSGHTPWWLLQPNTLVNPPDNESLIGSAVSQQYWKFDGSDDITEMSQAEKDAMDVHNAPAIQNEVLESESETSTTSTSYQLKATYAITELEPNTAYRFGWYCEVKNSSTSGRTEVQVSYTNGGEVVVANPSIEAEDYRDWVPFAGFYHIPAGVEPTHLDLKFRRQQNGTSSIRRARLELLALNG